MFKKLKEYAGRIRLAAPRSDTRPVYTPEEVYAILYYDPHSLYEPHRTEQMAANYRSAMAKRDSHERRIRGGIVNKTVEKLMKGR